MRYSLKNKDGWGKFVSRLKTPTKVENGAVVQPYCRPRDVLFNS